MSGPSQRHLTVLYGSQTGNARDVAHRIAREGIRHWFSVTVMRMDAFPVETLPQQAVVLFVASTTGQGETPSNMKRFWKFLLRKDLPPTSLCNTMFTVFGLGDSSYPIYNAVARRLYQRLLNLGARSLHPRGLGDDQHRLGYHQELEPWLDGLWKALLLLYPLPAGWEVMPPGRLLPPRYEVRCGGAAGAAGTAGAAGVDAVMVDESVNSEDEARLAPFGEGERVYTPFPARMLSNSRITSAENAQDVRHIELDIAGSYVDGGASSLAYEPGDVVCVHPRNNRADVVTFCELIGVDPDAELTLERRTGPTPAATASPSPSPSPPPSVSNAGGVVEIDMDVGAAAAAAAAIPELVTDHADLPSPCMASDLFGKYLAILNTPHRYFFQVLVEFATDPVQKERLQELVAPEGADDLYKYCDREHRTFLEVMQDFSSAVLPLDHLVELIPRLEPRRFSIASSPLAHPKQIHLTVAVVQYKTPYGRQKKGVCSTWLASLDPVAGDVFVPIGVERGSIRLPKRPEVPLILIGPGTGIAPFRSMCHEMDARRRLLHGGADGCNWDAQDGDADVAAEVDFYFGNRYEAGDFLYRDEWAALQAAGTVTNVFTAFSRDQPHKVYVQHRLREHGARVWELLSDSNATLMLAGNANNMPRDVRAAILEIARDHGGLADEEEAITWLKQLEKQRRYIVETWF